MDHLLLAVADRVATITLNEPHRRNALSTTMVSELAAVLAECDQREDVGCVVLTGAGSNFSAGADLQEFAASLDEASTEHWNSGQPWSDLFKLVPRMAKPVLASVQGYAVAGGCGLVAVCDLAIAADNSTFGTPEINIGIFPLFIFPALVRTLGRRNALDLCLTGRSIDAAEAQRLGLVNRVVPAPQLESTTAALARDLANKPAQTMRMGKHAFYRMADMDYDAAIDFARSLRGAFQGGQELRDGTSRFLNRRRT